MSEYNFIVFNTVYYNIQHNKTIFKDSEENLKHYLQNFSLLT